MLTLYPCEHSLTMHFPTAFQTGDPRAVRFMYAILHDYLEGMDLGSAVLHMRKQLEAEFGVSLDEDPVDIHELRHEMQWPQEGSEEMMFIKRAMGLTTRVSADGIIQL
jgi:hypothetical protein